MGDQLQRAGNYPLSADLWMIHQRGRRLAKSLVHPGGRLRVISGDLVPDVEAVPAGERVRLNARLTPNSETYDTLLEFAPGD